MKDTDAFMSFKSKWSERMCPAITHAMKNSVDRSMKRLETQPSSVGCKVLLSAVVSSGSVLSTETGSDLCEIGAGYGRNGVNAVKNRGKAAHGLEFVDAQLEYIGEALEKVEKRMERFVQNQEFDTVADRDFGAVSIYP